MRIGQGLHLTRTGSSKPAPATYFAVVGQSNAIGNGAAGASPASTEFYAASGTISALQDPVGTANLSSAWPAFANQWAASGRGRAIIGQHATGGSALIAAASPANNWSASGTLRAAAVSAINANIAGILADGRFELTQVIPVWCQGEQDANGVAVGTAGVTRAIYETELAALIDFFKAQLSRFTRFDIVRIGARNDRAQGSAWCDIRAAQESVVAARSDCRMIYRGASAFPIDALNSMGSATNNASVHWGQPGLNIAGKAAAIEAAKTAASAVPTAPAVLGSPQALTDTNAAAVASPSSTAYTMHASAKGLIVAAGLGRTGSSAGNAISSITFDGVPLTNSNKSVASNLVANSAGGAGAAGRCDNAVFYLSDVEYQAAKGFSIAGRSGNIVISYSASSNTVQAAFISVDSDIVPETTPSLNSNAGVNVLTANPAPGSAVLCVAAAGSCADGAAALTHSWTGLSEVQDSGASDGVRCSQFSVATGGLAANALATVTATLSANATQFGLAAACFRKRIDGEEAA